MPGINLTRVEASERAAIITTREYAVDLDLTQGEETALLPWRVLTPRPGRAPLLT
mgnify:CR=1 FL=1